MSTVYQFNARRIDGREQPLADFAGKVLLIVNVASECGLTPQYNCLERMWRDFRERGLVVLGFPCNQFGGQEPGDEAEIAAFCAARYEVSFPLFAKVEVNGETAHPLFRYLREAVPDALGPEDIKWNFTKFLVDRTGRVVARHAPTTAPAEFQREIEALLAQDVAA